MGSNRAARSTLRLRALAGATSAALLGSMLLAGVAQAVFTFNDGGTTLGAYDEDGNELTVAVDDIFGSDGRTVWTGSVGNLSRSWVAGPDAVPDDGPTPISAYLGTDVGCIPEEPQYFLTNDPQRYCWSIGFISATSTPGPWGHSVPIVAESAGGDPLVFDHWEVSGAQVDDYCFTGEVGLVTNALPGPDASTVPAVGFKGWVDVTTTPREGIFTANAIYAPLVPDTSAPIVTISAPLDCLVVDAGTAVPVSYSCIDPGDSDPDPDCVGDIANGALLDTSSEGEHTFSVVGTDADGNARTRTIHYTVIGDVSGPDTAIVSAPADPSAGGPQVFTFSGSDDLGVTGFECELDGGGFAACSSPHTEDIMISGSHTFEVRAVDGDGHRDTSPASYTWQVDATPPETSVVGDANFANPSRSSSAGFILSRSDDGGSGLASVECQLDSAPFEPCQLFQDQFVLYAGLTDGPHTFRARAIDAVGIVDPSPAAITWTIDTVAPVITIASPTATTYTVGSVVVADFACSDPGSGLATCTGTVADGQPIDTSSAGTRSFVVQATDAAGNANSLSVAYDVVPGPVQYVFIGFEQPVDMTGINVAKAGKTIPLKWRLVDAAGAPITTLTGVSVRATTLSCSLGTSPDLIEEYASGSSGLQNLGDGYYQFNWSTPKSYGNSCKTVHLDLGDGSDHTADFKFTK